MSAEIPTLNLAAAGLAISHLRDTSSTVLLRLLKAAHLLESLPEPPREPSLVYRPPGQQKPISLPIGPGLTIGRDPTCQIRLQDRPELSRRHFTVRPAADSTHFIAEDHGSSNGTLIDGVVPRLKRRELRDGDLILAGGLTFLFTNPQ